VKPLEDPIAFIDQRSGAAPLARKVMRYLFPDHWSFLLGEVAMYAFIVLVATGTFLALFFEPNLAETTYDGSYAPLQGAEMSVAYKSAVDLSFDVKAGLLMRQTHHWAADVFIVAIVLHLVRILLTGAYRKPTFPLVEEKPALVCPCHYSTFDPGQGGKVLFGPAGRDLPQLPLMIDRKGVLRAGGNFSGPPGPSWWGVRLWKARFVKR